MPNPFTVIVVTAVLFFALTAMITFVFALKANRPNQPEYRVIHMSIPDLNSLSQADLEGHKHSIILKCYGENWQETSAADHRVRILKHEEISTNAVVLHIDHAVSLTGKEKYGFNKHFIVIFQLVSLGEYELIIVDEFSDTAIEAHLFDVADDRSAGNHIEIVFDHNDDVLNIIVKVVLRSSDGDRLDEVDFRDNPVFLPAYLRSQS